MLTPVLLHSFLYKQILEIADYIHVTNLQEKEKFAVHAV